MGWFLSVRKVVEPSDCDALGHMNVSRYFGCCSDAGFSLQSELGLTASDMRTGRRLSFAVVHADSQFRAELMAGDTIFMESGVAALGGKSAVFHHRLFRAEDRKLAFETMFKVALMNLATRRAETVPEEIREAARTYWVGPEEA